MKKFIFLIPFLLLTSVLKGFTSDHPADRIIGYWITDGNSAKIEIYRQKDFYYGKIAWASDMYEADGKTLKKDLKNPDKSKRNVTIKNLLMLKNFRFKDGIWTEGTIYDPLSGNTYSCKMKLKGSKLEIRGYIGISLLGRTEVWQKSATTNI